MAAISSSKLKPFGLFGIAFIWVSRIFALLNKVNNSCGLNLYVRFKVFGIIKSARPVNN
jgi:hypothetical protein